VGPSVVALGLYPAVRLWRDPELRRRWRDYAWALGVFAGVAGLLFLPALESVLQLASSGSGRGHADLATARHGLMLLHGLPVNLPLWVWAIAGMAGVYPLWRRYPAECACLVAIVLVQLATQALARTWLQELPGVWFRYLAHLLPFMLAVLASAIASPLRLLGPESRQGFTAGVATLTVLLVLCLHHVRSDDYVLRADQSYHINPYLLFTPPRVEQLPVAQLESVRFYYLLRDQGAPGAVLEVPMTTTFPSYSLFQRIHHRPVYEGAFGDEPRQRLFEGARGLDFKRVIDLNAGSARLPGDVRFVILHRRPRSEITRVMDAAFSTPVAALQIRRIDDAVTRRITNESYDSGKISLPASLTRSWRLVYEDNWLSVYDVAPRGVG